MGSGIDPLVVAAAGAATDKSTIAAIISMGAVSYRQSTGGCGSRATGKESAVTGLCSISMGVASYQGIVNILQRNRLYRRRMIWLLPMHPLHTLSLQ